MAFNFSAVKSVGHFFAKAWKVVVQDAPIVAKDVAEAKPVIEAVEVAVLGSSAPIAVSATELACAGLGEICQIIVTLGAAGEQKLLDAGFDKAVLDAIKDAFNNKFGAIGKVFAPATK